MGDRRASARASSAADGSCKRIETKRKETEGLDLSSCNLSSLSSDRCQFQLCSPEADAAAAAAAVAAAVELVDFRGLPAESLCGVVVVELFACAQVATVGKRCCEPAALVGDCWPLADELAKFGSTAAAAATATR